MLPDAYNFVTLVLAGALTQKWTPALWKISSFEHVPHCSGSSISCASLSTRFSHICSICKTAAATIHSLLRFFFYLISALLCTCNADFDYIWLTKVEMERKRCGRGAERSIRGRQGAQEKPEISSVTVQRPSCCILFFHCHMHNTLLE